MNRLVKKVIDASTFEVSPKIGNNKYVRLSGIDSSILGKENKRAAYNKLKRLIEGKTVRIVLE
jgi:endonuclease YncB( thermonuclease family)